MLWKVKKCRNVSSLPFHSKNCRLFAVAKRNNKYDAVIGYYLIDSLWFPALIPELTVSRYKYIILVSRNIY